MEMVPNPSVEDHETDCRVSGVDTRRELGKTFVEMIHAHLYKGYDLIFFKNPGVFNSRSNK